MEMNIFYNETWSSLCDSDKIKVLQELENEMSVIQKRQARTVCQTDDINLCGANANAQYNFENPDFLYVRKINSGFESALSVIHEGIHAMYDDAFSDKTTNVYTYKKIDVKQLVSERTNKNIIFNHFVHENSNCKLLFNFCYIEKEIANFDSKCYLLQLITEYVNNQSNNVKNMNFINQLFCFYELLFIQEVSRLNDIKEIENQYKTNYSTELKIINYDEYADKKEVDVHKPKIVMENVTIVSHFNSQLNIYKNINNSSMIQKKDSNIEKFKKAFLSFFRFRIMQF